MGFTRSKGGATRIRDGIGSYPIVAAFVGLGLAIQTIGLHWSTDFQFHTAAIAEFATNLIDPRHVFLPIELPHHSLSLYHQLWGAFSMVSGLSAIEITQIVALVNLAALLFVFPRFVRVFVDHPKAPVVALLAVLLAWGPDAWRLSSLLNLNSIGFGLPYPSYFATWVCMLSIVLISRREWSPASSPLVLWLLLGLGALSVNAHAIVFGSYLILALGVAISRRSRQTWIALGAFIAGGVLMALAWPYFSIFDIAGASQGIDWQNRTVYESLLTRLSPALLGLGPLFVRARRDVRDPLVISFVGLLAVFAWGFLSQTYVLGRVIVAIALVLHLSLAGGFLQLWSRYRRTRLRLAIGAVSGCLVLAMLVLASPALVRMIPAPFLPDAVAGDERLAAPAEWINEAAEELQPQDVVLAPADISQYFPSTGAKVVYVDPAPYVTDQAEREALVSAFFDSVDTSVLDRYGVTWVAFRADSLPSAVAESIAALGDTVDFGPIRAVRLKS